MLFLLLTFLKVTKGKQRKDFFTIPEYEQWLESTPDANKWESKYFKVILGSILRCRFLILSDRGWEQVAMRMLGTTLATWKNI